MNVNEGKLFNHAHGPQINLGVATDKSEVILHCQSPERVAELCDIFRRALNTWEPEKCPQWALELMDHMTGTPTQPERSAPSRTLRTPSEQVQA